MQLSIRKNTLCLAILAAGPAFGQMQLEEIVVTAQKREQSLQEVPVAVSAVSEETIVANRIQDVGDLSRIAPNLSVREGAGGGKTPQYSMRGLYTFGTSVGTDKGISLYIDGVYIQNVAGSVFEFADVKQIEVLRGPQGTLFGRNATGGAVSVTTRDPTGEFGIRQELSIGNYDSVRAKTRVDLPQMGPLSVSFNYLHSEREGDMDNLGGGTVWTHAPGSGEGSFRSPNTLGDENVEAFFLATKLDLRDDLDISYKFDYSKNDFTASGVGASYLPTPAQLQSFGGADSNTLSPSGMYNQLYYAMPEKLRTPITRHRPDAVNNWFHGPSESESYGHNLTASWQFSEWGTVKNILSKRTADLNTIGYQLDGLGGLTVFNGFAVPGLPPITGMTGPAGTPFAGLISTSVTHQEQWSNELQFNLDFDFATITAGYIYFNDEQDTGGYDNSYNVMQFIPIMGQNTVQNPPVPVQLFPGFTVPLYFNPQPFALPQNTGFKQHHVETTSQAVYMQPEFHVTDKLDLVAGIRWTRDEKDGTESAPSRLTVTANTLANGAVVPISYRDERETWMVGANYKVNDDIFTYAKYVTGYISGGNIGTIEFKPETAESAEVGIKADMLDGRLRANLSVFSVDYGSIQQNTLGALVAASNPTAATFPTVIIPAGDATADGFELETTFIPTDNLSLGLSLGYTDFKWDGNLFPGFVVNAGQPGVQVFHRPEWTANLSAGYVIPEVFAGGNLNIRADAGYKEGVLMTNDIAPGSGPTAMEDPAYTKANTNDDSWIVNARIALEEMRIGDNMLTVALWGKNLFDEDTMVQASPASFVTFVIYEKARTFGIEFIYELD